MELVCDGCGGKRMRSRGCSFNHQTNTTGHIFECARCEEWIVTRQRHGEKPEFLCKCGHTEFDHTVGSNNAIQRKVMSCTVTPKGESRRCQCNKYVPMKKKTVRKNSGF